MVDFEGERSARLALEKRRRKEEAEKQMAEQQADRMQKQKEASLKSYGSVFEEASMHSNKSLGPVDPKKFEEDFF